MQVQITAYITAAIAFLALDYVWLKWVAKSLYTERLGDLLREKPKIGAAAAFYLLYVVGIVVFAVLPAIASGEAREATMLGALFGFLAYATYDVTNYATLRQWPLGVACLDVAWGTCLTAFCALVSYYATSWVIGT